MVAHHTRDMDHSSPAAADGHQAAWIRHPLDPLDAGEIKRAVEILRREQPVSPDARFVSVSLNEPPKDQVAFATPDSPAPGQATGPDAAVPREAFVVLLEPRQHAVYEAVVSLTTGSLLSWRLVPAIVCFAHFLLFLGRCDLLRGLLGCFPPRLLFGERSLPGRLLGQLPGGRVARLLDAGEPGAEPP